MGDKHFTLLELHHDGDLQIGPKTMGVPGEDGEGGSEGEEIESGTAIDVEGAEELDVGGGGGSAAGIVVGLIVLLVVAIVVKKLLGGEDEEIEIE